MTKKNFAEFLRLYGYAIPKTEEEVNAFEKIFKSSYKSPEKWSSVEDIINGNTRKNKKPSDDLKNNPSIESLSMAAREGKEILDAIKNKMRADRNAKKK